MGRKPLKLGEIYGSYDGSIATDYPVENEFNEDKIVSYLEPKPKMVVGNLRTRALSRVREQKTWEDVLKIVEIYSHIITEEEALEEWLKGKS